MTNFATFIDSANDRAPIAQRGHAKQKRADLRLVGLGLVVTRDGGVPLVGHAYPGNRPDVAVFAAVVDELVARHRRVGRRRRTADRGLRRRAELGVELRPPGRGRAALRRLAATLGAPGPAGHPGPPAQRGRRRALPRADRLRDPRPGTRRYPARRAHPLPDAARQTVRRVRPDHRQGHPGAAELAAILARGRTRRDRAGVEAADRPHPRPRWLDRVLVRAAHRRHTGRAAASPGRSTPPPGGRWKPSCSANGSWSPTGRTGRSSSWSPATAPKATPRAGSASSKTPSWSASPRCGTGPTRRSGCTSPTACSRSSWPT